MFDWLADVPVAPLAWPGALWLLAVVPVLWVLGIRAWLKRRRALRRLGGGLALRALTTPPRGWPTLQALCWSTALTVLLVGIAGPRWGTDTAQHAISGRDLVVVLDLSRSMLAEQPSRLDRARRALFDLADSLQRQGGHRVALVAFAARPRLVCPLTHDYDHFREAVRTQDAHPAHPELRPGPEGHPSGTRLGAALLLALEAHDARLEGYQDILVVSDGDDPAGDEEWAEGATAAKARGIAVFCLGVGDLATASTIPTEDGQLQHEGQVVRTRLEERPLRELARRTGGSYFPGRTNPLPTGALYQEVLEGKARTDDHEVPLALYRLQYAWFFGPALGLFALSLLLGGLPAKAPA
ncbi:MAG: VWA domain-containing protein [Gemmataceae bacterium]|nr:VWA domain-containing protein [Gemmataceae bacterium]